MYPMVGANDSDWLAAEQARKRRIKIYAIIGVIIVCSQPAPWAVS